ncbi:MAG: spore germination protein, partial [Clostridiales bacterium]|nr:spore germination protein [Clostridiales bacterium]
LREGGLRLPRPVGQAISIVGALVMGDAAVSAGLVGAPMVIAIALTAVASFVVPAKNESSSLLRIVMMCLAAFMGMYGIVIGLLAVMTHLATMSSFGVPFFEGFTWSRDQQDIAVRAPLWAMVKRPKDIAQGDVTRRRFFIPPLRPHQGDSSEEDQ